MYNYTPNILHPLLSIMLVVLFTYFGADKTKPVSVAWIGGLLSFVVFAVTLRAIVVDFNNKRTDTESRWMEAFAGLDDDGKMAVIFQFPAVRYHMRRGVPHPYWRDTNVKMEHLQLFLETSDKQFISPERIWGSKGMPPRSVWSEIKTQLEEDRMVEPDSAAGSHSWKWVGDSYQHMLAWWKPGRTIREDVDIAMSGPTRQYASETEQEQVTSSPL